MRNWQICRASSLGAGIVSRVDHTIWQWSGPKCAKKFRTSTSIVRLVFLVRFAVELLSCRYTHRSGATVRTHATYISPDLSSRSRISQGHLTVISFYRHSHILELCGPICANEVDAGKNWLSVFDPVTLTFDLWPSIYQVLGGQLRHKIWEFPYSGEEGFNPTNLLTCTVSHDLGDMK